MPSWWKNGKKLLLVVLLSISYASYGAVSGYAGLDLSVSDDAAKFGVYSLKETPSDITNLGLDLFFNTQSDYFVDVFGSISRKGLLGNRNLELGLKGKLFYLDQDSNSKMGYGLMLGVLGRYWLPTPMPSAIYADYLYAPEVIVFGDAKNAYDWTIRGELQVTQNIMAYLGVRQLQAEFSSTSHEFDGNAHVGVKIAF
ncbi:hypothetical protein AVO42_02440 [Thiomicrospira sp. XS5]|uniref:YfaZ family outer membrane protein n=1 Tax=Thiomicrospira sp. XS5 TaxID=1775636 RepID=UPI00074A7BBA|nr:YfaZ family outer membrane protein [Thiomicrospira sp. XS5]KUJ74292.1 hypothetical protein AVO42_02440 [Thiomicrospira sp. XS5]